MGKFKGKRWLAGAMAVMLCCSSFLQTGVFTVSAEAETEVAQEAVQEPMAVEKTEEELITETVADPSLALEIKQGTAFDVAKDFTGLGLKDGDRVELKKAAIEDGTTFEENAQIKAKAIAKYLPDDIILADDSGLEIDYLNKEPGIYSARYAGVDTSYDIKNQMLLDRLKGVPDEKRTARFVCAIAAAFPDGTVETVRGTIEGMIGYEIAGEHGFGYDPIFYVPEYGCTTAEMDPVQKNELSHRGRALRAMRAIMEVKEREE